MGASPRPYARARVCFIHILPVCVWRKIYGSTFPRKGKKARSAIHTMLRLPSAAKAAGFRIVRLNFL